MGYRETDGHEHRPENKRNAISFKMRVVSDGGGGRRTLLWGVAALQSGLKASSLNRGSSLIFSAEERQIAEERSTPSPLITLPGGAVLGLALLLNNGSQADGEVAEQRKPQEAVLFFLPLKRQQVNSRCPDVGINLSGGSSRPGWGGDGWLKFGER